MGVKVCKFGGTSLADAKQIMKVKKIVESDNSRLFIVPSAPGKRCKEDIKITDMLLACRDLATKNERFENILKDVKERFEVISKELDVDIDLHSEFMEIKYNLLKGATKDYVMSRGEYLNGKIISKYLNFEFVDASEVIRFDETGVFSPEKTNELLKSRISGGKFVIPGFYGGDEIGSIKVFSRGGSDITGALVAKAVNAEIYENWTDVSGLLMTDPRIVQNPMPISTISYKELRELSSMGATVLHEDAIYPAREAGIPINIRNTNSPEELGTMICESPSEKAKIITGIAGKKNYGMISITKNGINNNKVLIQHILEVLKKYNIKYEHTSSSIDSISVIISNINELYDVDGIVEEINKDIKPDGIVVSDELALIGVVGESILSKPRVISTLFDALSNLGIQVRMIDLGSNDMNIILAVDELDYEYAVKGIYNAYANLIVG